MNPIFPLYALLLRVSFIIIFILLISIFVKSSMLKFTGIKKYVSLFMVGIIVAITVYTLYFHGNIYLWNNNNNDILTNKILTIVESDNADISVCENNSNNPILYVSPKMDFDGSVEDLIHPFLCSQKSWERKCMFIDDTEQKIIIEPAVGTRFLTTPTGMFESKIYIVSGNTYYEISLVVSAKYPCLQPLMVTIPMSRDICDVLDKAIIYYERSQ